MREYIKPEIEIIECEPFCVQSTSGWRNINTGEWKPGNMAEHGWEQFIGKDHGDWEWVGIKRTSSWEEEENI